jgi:hypothetical protein
VLYLQLCHSLEVGRDLRKQVLLLGEVLSVDVPDNHLV